MIRDAAYTTSILSSNTICLEESIPGPYATENRSLPLWSHELRRAPRHCSCQICSLADLDPCLNMQPRRECRFSTGARQKYDKKFHLRTIVPLLDPQPRTYHRHQ